jgi:hypothetical protein
MSSLKGTIKPQGPPEGTLGSKSMSSMDESFNNRTMQYTERSGFQEDI